VVICHSGNYLGDHFAGHILFSMT